MPRNQKNNKRPSNKKKSGPPRRKAYVQKIQMANLKPSTSMVRFEGKKKYQCLLQTGANNKSILRIPASYIADPVAETGTWTQDNSARLVETTANFYGKYNHYKVLGSRITVSVKTLLADGTQQLNNMVLIARVTNTNVYTISSELKDLEGDYAVKSRQWGGYSNTGYRQARVSMGYSPKKQLGLKDVEDNGTIKVSTASYGLSASDNTFFNVIICGELDSSTSGHSSAIVDVKMNYLLRFEEPRSDENAPVAL